MNNPQQARYQQILRRIQTASTPTALSEAVAPLLQETGFGSSSMTDDETGEEICLDYLEIAECLMETDRLYFQKPIELLILTQQRSREMSQRIAPCEPKPEITPWQQFL